jgi:hypothetical protein
MAGSDGPTLPDSVAAVQAPSANSVSAPAIEPARTAEPVVASASPAFRGEPVAGASVFLIGGRDPLRASGHDYLVQSSAALLDDSAGALHAWESRTWSEKDGSFRFDGVDPFSAFSVEAIEESVGIGAVAAPQHATSEGVTVALEPMIVVRGRVSDVRGEVVPNAAAFCDFGIDDRHITATVVPTTKADGSFCVTTKLVPGLIFGAECNDGRSARTPPLLFDPVEPLNRRVELVLREEGGACHGRVVDRSGAPIDRRATEVEADGRRAGWDREATVQLFSCGCRQPRDSDGRRHALRIGDEECDYHAALDGRLSRSSSAIARRSARPSLADAGVNGPICVDATRLEAPSCGAAGPAP